MHYTAKPVYSLTVMCSPPAVILTQLMWRHTLVVKLEDFLFSRCDYLSPVPRFPLHTCSLSVSHTVDASAVPHHLIELPVYKAHVQQTHVSWCTIIVFIESVMVVYIMITSLHTFRTRTSLI